MILAAILIGLSFFDGAGMAGQFFIKGARFLIGETVFLIPLIFILGGLVFLNTKYNLGTSGKEKRVLWPIILATLFVVIGLSGVLGSMNPLAKKGGSVGYFLSWPLLKYFNFWATEIIFLCSIIIGLVIFWQFLRSPRLAARPVSEDGKVKIEIEPKTSIIRKIFAPKFKVKEITPVPQEQKPGGKQPLPLRLETKTIAGAKIFSYQPPPLDLLETDHGVPTSGDTRVNSAIIKKALQNFGIEVAMGEVNTGPTVTQYTFKPAEGIKLSKITTLSNDLSLALASHPIRIEAPIPGRSLVGIEVPNKVRARVGLRSLLESPNFQKSPANLLIALGKDVGGTPFYADLARMPHLLVAGSTGTGKTIFLNSLILSLLYQPSTSVKSAGPETLRFILIDPKRVEFPVYHNLPHLLCPVIYSAAQTVNVLRWLTGEMERRFDILSASKTRDIGRYNEYALKEGIEPLPFIVVVIDELADLMAVKGREIEAGIVRLAQMARAVGIHLVVATQRPSVEVITGLIKANITSRVTFQLASQVDSRTVLDMAGAEKLLGSGDMLFISAEIIKPKRIQAAYTSDKELRGIINYINSKNGEFEPKTETEVELMQELEKTPPEETKTVNGSAFSGEEDSLYEEAKKLVLETKKASASFLQRRLRLGYARAARILDFLEERGVVGPAEGAKPREVYGEPIGKEITGVETGSPEEMKETKDVENSGKTREEEEDEKEEWEKV